MDAVLELAGSKGIHDLTTVAIAKRAGIRQPNFYNHFKNIDDCLAAAVREAVMEQLRIDENAFERLNVAIMTGQPYIELSCAYHRAMLERLLKRPDTTQLFVRHRGEPSAFGAELQKLHKRAVTYVATHIWDWAIASGLSGKHLPEIELLAELQVGMVYTAALAVTEGTALDIETAAVALAYAQDATIKATFKRLAKRKDE